MRRAKKCGYKVRNRTNEAAILWNTRHETALMTRCEIECCIIKKKEVITENDVSAHD